TSEVILKLVQPFSPRLTLDFQTDLTESYVVAASRPAMRREKRREGRCGGEWCAWEGLYRLAVHTPLDEEAAAYFKAEGPIPGLDLEAIGEADEYRRRRRRALLVLTHDRVLAGRHLREFRDTFDLFFLLLNFFFEQLQFGLERTNFCGNVLR